MTPPTDPYVVNTKSVGLKNIHETAFTEMAKCNHRVVAVQRKTPIKFIVTTNCCATNWSHNTQDCQGQALFELRKEGPYLILATFEHSDGCKLRNPGLPSSVIENRPCDIVDFSTQWPTYMTEAGSFAEKDYEAKLAKRQREVDSGHDVVSTPFELMQSGKISGAILGLGDQMLEFYSSQAAGEGTTS